MHFPILPHLATLFVRCEIISPHYSPFYMSRFSNYFSSPFFSMDAIPGRVVGWVAGISVVCRPVDQQYDLGLILDPASHAFVLTQEIVAFQKW
jgi:hypothetical protein